jgi:hypothetical protein
MLRGGAVYRGIVFKSNSNFAKSVGGSENVSPNVRKYFPEQWIFDTIDLNSTEYVLSQKLFKLLVLDKCCL